ncbi:hypothetical protein GGX14DRAFT_463988, partial [Mycena pura]
MASAFTKSLITKPTLLLHLRSLLAERSPTILSEGWTFRSRMVLRELVLRRQITPTFRGGQLPYGAAQLQRKEPILDRQLGRLLTYSLPTATIPLRSPSLKAQAQSSRYPR